MRSVQFGLLLSITVTTLLVACGQNAHVTQPDPIQGPGPGEPLVKTQVKITTTTTPSGGVTQPTIQVFPTPGISPVAPPPIAEGCLKHFEGRYPIRSITLDECKSMVLPYHSSKERTLRSQTVAVHSRPEITSKCGGCNSYKDTVQLIFSADVTQLPPRSSVVQVNKVGLKLAVIRNVDGIDQSELFCLLDERICSGARYRAPLNREFWANASPARPEESNRYFLEQLSNEKFWTKKSSGAGSTSTDLAIDFADVIRGSGYDLESVLYAGGPARTFRMVIADDMEACAGELVVDLDFNACVAEQAGQAGGTP